MTATPPDTGQFQHSQFGTLTVIGWTGAHPEDNEDMPFLLAYSLGDGRDGPEVAEAAARRLIGDAGLTVGGVMPDSSQVNRLPLKLIVQGGQAVLTMPHMTTQYPAPPEWVAAADKRKQVYFMIATRPWPEAKPGRPVSEEALKSFVDEDMLASSAHCVLPVSGLQG
ncbi:DUF5949 family protein [Streptomyces sp. NPDC054796]|uniref:Uncharacterized protein n=1 Tax=Streptomyces daliensis TaxID=299421 RepID=A0A8T4IKM3_9ACTN|nr:hypothetical protein [Streptomyces daliensis]